MHFFFFCRGYHEYIDDALPPESPYLYGLHPNAEIGFLSTKSEKMFKTIFELQPRDSGGGEAGGVSKEEKVIKSCDTLVLIISFFPFFFFR